MEQNKLYREYSEDELARERASRQMKDFRYIHWHTEAERILVNHDEYNEMSRMLKENGSPLCSSYKTRRLEWCHDLTYHVDLETRER